CVPSIASCFIRKCSNQQEFMRLVCLCLKDTGVRPQDCHICDTVTCSRKEDHTQKFGNLINFLLLFAPNTPTGPELRARVPGRWPLNPDFDGESHLPFDCCCGPERTMVQHSTFMRAQSCSPAAETVAPPPFPPRLLHDVLPYCCHPSLFS
ncbi:unnamed protein product, partial [Ectocarpus sp. 13 AM-2016]